MEACHREWYLTFAERAARELTRPDQVTWYRQLTLEHDNMRAALDACEDDPVSAEARLRIVAAMGQFWWPRKAGEGRRRLADALARAPTEPSPARAAALSWLARFELYYGDPLVGQDLALNALSDARAVDDPVSMSRALVGLVLASGDDLDARRSFIEELVSIAGRSAHKTLEASALSHLSMVALDAGDVQRSRLLAQESDALARAIGDAWTRAGPLSYLGWSAMAEGRLDDAESHFRTLVDLGEGWGGYHNPIGLVGLGRVNVLRGDFRQAREVYGRMLTDLRETSAESLVLADALLHMASVEELEGRHERAQRLAGANEAWHAAHGGGRSTWEPTVRAPLLRGQVPIPPVPSEPELVRARQAGRAMTLDQAATYALDTFDRE